MPDIFDYCHAWYISCIMLTGNPVMPDITDIFGFFFKCCMLRKGILPCLILLYVVSKKILPCLISLLYVVIGRKSWEEGAPVQDPGDRWTRDREDLHHQALCPPVLLSALQSHCILINHKQSIISFILFTVLCEMTLLEIRKLGLVLCWSVPGTILTVWPWIIYYLLSLTFAFRLEWILLWRSWTGMQTQLFDFSYGTLQVYMISLPINKEENNREGLLIQL